MMYRHLNTGVVTELQNRTETAVTLKVIETGEIKEVKLATFKRWWKPFTEEAKPAETETVEPETQDSEEAPAPTEETTSGDEMPKPEAKKVYKDEPLPKKIPADEDKPLTLSEVVGKLEGLFNMLNGIYFEGKLPTPIITVQSTPKAYGHCSTKKIWKQGKDGEDEGQYEINIGAEFLNRPSENTAATMLHEMVHLYCRENGLDETCQNGRYHNKLFKQECEARDLVIEYDRTNGYSTTLPGTAFAEKLRSNGYELTVKFARYTVEKQKKKAERTKAHKYVCPVCGQEVKTTQELSLICGICKVDMERAD